MSDVMTAEQRSKLMSRIRGKNTSPELKLRSAAWAMGLRYRLHRRIGSSRPDLVFMRARLAIFVDGCFWHRCPLHGVMPKGHHSFWKKKLERNVLRDVEATKNLVANGWAVLRLWEHEIEASPTDCARRIAAMLGKMRGLKV